MLYLLQAYDSCNTPLSMHETCQRRNLVNVTYFRICENVNTEALLFLSLSWNKKIDCLPETHHSENLKKVRQTANFRKSPCWKTVDGMPRLKVRYQNKSFNVRGRLRWTIKHNLWRSSTLHDLRGASRKCLKLTTFSELLLYIVMLEHLI